MNLKNQLLLFLVIGQFFNPCLGQQSILNAQFSANDTIPCIGDSVCFQPTHNFALDFDGVDDFVLVPNPATLRPETMVSVEAWVYFKSHTAWVSLAGNVWDTGANTSGYDLGTGGGAGNRIEFVVSNGNINYGTLTSPPIPLNQWNHFAGTYDGNNRRLYMNGVLVATAGDISGPIDYSTPQLFRIGAFIDDDEDFKLHGMLDEVRVWDTVRTQAQIVANMNKQLDGGQPHLIALYSFNDGPGSTVTLDSSVFNHQGTLTNMDPNTDFVNSTAMGWTYSWDFGDGSGLSSDSVVCHSFQTRDTFNVVLNITDGDTNTGSDTLAVIVSFPIIDSVTVVNPNCPGDSDGSVHIHASG